MMNEKMSDTEFMIRSIDYVENLLERFRRALNGGHETFSELNISDIAEILGFEYEEIEEKVK